MTILSTFARLIGIPESLAEDALHSERAARHTLSRRGMMGALAAMAAGSVVSLPVIATAAVNIRPPWLNGAVYSWKDVKFSMAEAMFTGIVSITYEGPASDIGCHISEAIRLEG